MYIIKNIVKVLGLLFIALFVFTGQTSLESQMEELNRLQAQLEALQTGVKKEKLDINIKSPNEEEREKSSSFPKYQLVEFNYKNYNNGVDGFTELKSIMKIDSYSGDTWLFKIDGQEGFWKKINQ